MSQMKAGGQNGLKQLETSNCPLVLTLPCNLAQTSSNNTIFVSDDDYAEGRNLTRHVHFARYGRYLSRSKGPLFVSGRQQNNGPTTHNYFPHCNFPFSGAPSGPAAGDRRCQAPEQGSAAGSGR